MFYFGKADDRKRTIYEKVTMYLIIFIIFKLKSLTFLNSKITIFLLFILSSCSSSMELTPKPPSLPIIPTSACNTPSLFQNIKISKTLGESGFPDMVWNGKNYVITWWDKPTTEPEILVAQITQKGVAAFPVTKISSKGWPKPPKAAFDGRETHIVWSEEPKVMSVRLENENLEPKALTDQGTNPSAASWGASVWTNAGALYFLSDAMFNTKTKQAMLPSEIATGGIEAPVALFNGSIYAILWSESSQSGRKIVMQRVDPMGQKLGLPMIVSESASRNKNPVAVWNNKHLITAWTVPNLSGENTNNPHNVMSALLPEVGDAPIWTKQLPINSALDQIAIASSGEEYSVAWVSTKQNSGCEIMLQRFSLSGTPLKNPVSISNGNPLNCSKPSLVWDGKGYGITWHDDRGNMETEVYFSRLACNKGEEGYTEIEDQAESQNPSEMPTLKQVF